ncbi:hypothetical protein B0H13DRAFT_2298872 [Mycena leptocephala]|nr:hypothetical protein B0H13DRAFT_2298872 [Mycena leptocephala]
MSGLAKRLALRQIATTSQVNSNDTCKKRIYTLITSSPVRFGSMTAPKQKLDLQLRAHIDNGVPACVRLKNGLFPHRAVQHKGLAVLRTVKINSETASTGTPNHATMEMGLNNRRRGAECGADRHGNRKQQEILSSFEPREKACKWRLELRNPAPLLGNRHFVRLCRSDAPSRSLRDTDLFWKTSHLRTFSLFNQSMHKQKRRKTAWEHRTRADVTMSDAPLPPKPKPGSLRDRIAAFEKPSTSNEPARALPPLRPKLADGVPWKPKPPSPPADTCFRRKSGGE